MYYTIYRITNIINKKTYIGMHKTNRLNDNYMGSGKLLKKAIQKYGIENFKKEILHVFDSYNDMVEKEEEILNEDFVLRSDNYNISLGGIGGSGPGSLNPMYGKKQTPRQKKVARQTRINLNKKIIAERVEKHGNPWGEYRCDWTGRKHSNETKSKMRRSKNSGEKNSQYGTKWITDGLTNRKIDAMNEIPEGWYAGRTITHPSKKYAP